MIGLLAVLAAFGALAALCRGAIIGHNEWLIPAGLLWLSALAILIIYAP